MVHVNLCSSLTSEILASNKQATIRRTSAFSVAIDVELGASGDEVLKAVCSDSESDCIIVADVRTFQSGRNSTSCRPSMRSTPRITLQYI